VDDTQQAASKAAETRHNQEKCDQHAGGAEYPLRKGPAARGREVDRAEQHQYQDQEQKNPGHQFVEAATKEVQYGAFPVIEKRVQFTCRLR
jgi:hypothetical protein